MSLMRPILNAYLRLTEKPYLARVARPISLRQSFEAKARLFFHPPLGTRFRQGEIAGVPVTSVRAPWVAEADGPLILYFHGGGYVFGSPRTHRAMLAWLSRAAQAPACLPDYAKAPEHAFPAAVEDALAIYRAVMDRPGGVVLGGDSAGGGLALALLGEICRLNLPRPLGCFGLSPLTDLGHGGESLMRNAQAEVLLPAARAAELAEMYLQGADPDDPRASPLRAGFDGAGPVWLTAGDTEILLDDTRRMTSHLRDQGIEVTEVIERDLPHVWPIFHNTLPEARETLTAIAAWISSLSPVTDDS
ncbi:alpha/beta hydrolase fold domain-containing protein [Roseovarius aestuariivivens]|uniref:alpha/beta hydrolase fold domain-containing protein n=1 Tax=Roseovarius aestuariivivens TaxID=1888910 RepID=UPI00107FDAAD|nr:alpha/beta hydrolase fold domain-containing protein [Roseovarius aestuariivivens]